jgi:hypothetical protein
MIRRSKRHEGLLLAQLKRPRTHGGEAALVAAGDALDPALLVACGVVGVGDS